MRDFHGPCHFISGLHPTSLDVVREEYAIHLFELSQQALDPFVLDHYWLQFYKP